MKAIAAVDKNWAIGFQDNLLIRIPNDQKNFRKVPTGHTVVLGRRTLAGFPNGLPLPNRNNIILSKNPNFEVKGATVVHSFEELKEVLSEIESDDIYIIGGGKIYDMLVPYCDEAIITMIDYSYQADTYFPNLEKLPEWEMVEESEEETCFSIEYTFRKYVNHSPLPLV